LSPVRPAIQRGFFMVIALQYKLDH